MKKRYYEQTFLRLNHKENFYRPGLCLEVEQTKRDILFISRQSLSNFSSLFFSYFHIFIINNTLCRENFSTLST